MQEHYSVLRSNDVCQYSLGKSKVTIWQHCEQVFLALGFMTITKEALEKAK
jgi:hypothetical protein